MTQEYRNELCEWCKNRKPRYICAFCGGNFCEKCIIETSSGEIYCKSCQLAAVRSDQACD
ncbi:MAG: hypothetical protein ACFFFH_03215 [Candidatus Thorarchaeota archaeon]